MLKENNKGIRHIKYTRSGILDVYANASRNNDVDSFYRWLMAANDMQALPISISDIEALLQFNHGAIQNNLYLLNTEGHVSPSGRYNRRGLKEEKEKEE